MGGVSGGDWEGHGVYFVPLTWSVGSPRKASIFRKQWVNVKEWSGREGILAPGKSQHGIAPFPLPQTSHHSGSAWERTERAGLTGPRFQSALGDVPNENVDFWGRD